MDGPADEPYTSVSLAGGEAGQANAGDPKLANAIS